MSSDKQDTRTRILEATWQLLEESNAHGVRMSDIAKAAGVSRQAVYLHFESRTDLMIATRKYVDDKKGLNERLKVLQSATTGADLLEAIVDVWGNYIPEIYGVAKAMLSRVDEDEAMAAAWNDCMSELRDVCRQAIDELHDEKLLAKEWSRNEAVDMFSSALSIHNWEHLTRECGWTTAQYVDGTKTLLKRAFVDRVPVR